MQKIARNKNE